MAEAVVLEGGSYWQRYGAKQGEREVLFSPTQSSCWCLTLAKPDGSWQTKDPADKVFKDQDPGTWNKIERQQMHLGGGWAGTNRE